MWLHNCNKCDYLKTDKYNIINYYNIKNYNIYLKIFQN